MDVHTLITGLTARVRQMEADMADVKAALVEMAAAMAKPEPEKPAKKGGD